MNSSRHHYLDSLRGVAALIVVVHHYFYAFYPYTVFGNREASFQHYGWESLFHSFPFNFFIAGHFAVCIFFILSGFVLSHGYLGRENIRFRIAASLAKRPIRLGGLVVFTIIVACILWYCGLFYNSGVSQITGSRPFYSSHWDGELSLGNLPFDMTVWAFRYGYKYNPPLWTINIELYGSVLVFVFLFLFGCYRWRIVVLGIATLLLTRYYYYQCFLLGIIIADISKNHNGVIPIPKAMYFRYLSLLTGLFLACYPLLLDSTSLGESMYGFLPNLGGNYCMLGSVLVFISVIGIPGIRRLLEIRIFKFLGRISYGLYVIHFLILGSFSSWMFLKLYESMSYNASFAIIFIVGFPIIIALSFLVTLLVDEPTIKLSSAIGKYVSARLEVVRNYAVFKKAPDL